MPLSDEKIQQLLAEQLNKAARPNSGGGKQQPPNAKHLPRPQQVGPLRWANDAKPCTGGVAGRCGVSTLIRLEGRPGAVCNIHALYELNKIIIDLTMGEDYLERCNCNAGKYSKGNMHVVGCPLYILDKETANEYL